MRIARLGAVSLVVLAIGVALVSGGSNADPRTPAALPGLPPPFLGTAVTGDGGLTAAIDAYGDVVDLRAGPAGAALIDNPSARQAAGTVPADTGIVPRLRIGDGPALPMWQAGSVSQRYLAGTNVVRTVARFGGARMTMTAAASGETLAIEIQSRAKGGLPTTPSVGVDVAPGAHCASVRRAGLLDLLCGLGRAVPPVPSTAASDGVRRACAEVVERAVRDGRRWLVGSTPLGEGGISRRLVGDESGGGSSSGRHVQPAPDSANRLASGGANPPGRQVPAWARSMYRRSLLTIHALTSRATGAVAAGARDGWAYVWPRDAATAALALAASGHHAEARHVASFLTNVDLGAAARFTESGAPVPGRPAQGDASGWTNLAAKATGLNPPPPLPWRNRADYQESTPGTYLANALSHLDAGGPKTGHRGRFSAHRRRALGWIAREFGTARGLVRAAGDRGSGLDSAAAWAVRPFGLRPLYRDAEATLLNLLKDATPYGITPGEGWTGGSDPWSAPTAWTAWALAALAAEATTEARKTERRGPRTNLPVREGEVPSVRSPHELRQEALRLLADLRRAATPAGDLPERVGAATGIPTSTTPLLWSSAFTVLALRELWP